MDISQDHMIDNNMKAKLIEFQKDESSISQQTYKIQPIVKNKSGRFEEFKTKTKQSDKFVIVRNKNAKSITPRDR